MSAVVEPCQLVFDNASQSWRWLTKCVEAVFTTRAGGVSLSSFESLNLGDHVGDDPELVLENRRRAAAQLGLLPNEVAAVTQVHGADVWTDLVGSDALDNSVRWDLVKKDFVVEADALVTTRINSAVAVGIADCLPIAITAGDAIAAIHAGWRSLVAGVIEKTVAVLKRSTGSTLDTGEMQAVIGPAIGACCMEVGVEVADKFNKAVVHAAGQESRRYLDLRAEAVRRLQESGCHSVQTIDECTCCDLRYFSHRRDGARSGRQALLVCRRNTYA